jgi:uncharacterized protein (DUF1778 family)
MKPENQIQIKCKNSEKEKIKLAAEKVGLGYSTFSRMAALKEAALILENKQQDKI